MSWRRGAIVLALAGAAAAATTTATWAVRPTSKGGAQGQSATAVNDGARRIDVNAINMWVTNFGSWAYDIATGNAGLIFPRGTQKTAVFSSGLWLGGQVGTDTRVEVAEYSYEYGPGTMSGAQPDDPNDPRFRVWKVARFSGNPADTAHVDRPADELTADPTADPLVHHSWSEYMANAAVTGAPWKVYRMPVTATPDPTDSVDVPGPDVSGDLMCWAIYNDADPSLHTNNAGGSAPLGLEIAQSTFAFNQPGALGNTVFLRFNIKNKGGNQINNMYVSLWADPDLGGFTDDLVGCDIPRSLGFVYNSTNSDQTYGSAPPALGYDFFKGPVTAAGDTLGLSSFNKYINGTDPSSTEETYNYMQGLNADGSPVIDPKTGQQTRFVVPGDPVLGTGWLDTSPADRRMMLTAGPFTMAPGDSQEVVGAIVVGQGKDRLSSVSAMKFNDDLAQVAFDVGFNLPRPPSQPVVQVTEDSSAVTLCWDAASRLNYNEPGYFFEGYNVYQGASVSGPWTRVATFDVVDQIRIIYDTVFDPVTGQVIPSYPVAFGSDAGVSYCYTANQDAVRGGPLHNGTQYYYAVTAYSYNPDAPAGLKVRENSPQVIRVMPQTSPSGTDFATASAAEVTHTLINPLQAPSTAQVIVQVEDPALVTGDTYQVGFIPLPAPVFGQVGQDTATATVGWFLYDVTKRDTLLIRQLNLRGDEDYQIVDGLRVIVKGAYFPLLQTVDYVNLNADHRRALTGVNWSGNQDWFFGGAGYDNDFFGSTLDPTVAPDSFTTVEVRFSDTETQKAYRYLRLEKASDGSAPPQTRGYLYGGFHTVPFTMWDAVRNVQIDAAFVEAVKTDDAGTILPADQQYATLDSTWMPDASDFGGREYLFALRTPYTDTPKPEYEVDDVIEGGVPGLYALWAAKRTADDVVDPGDLIRFVWAVPPSANDIYTFDTSKLETGNATLAKNRLDRVHPVPNPYFNMSRYELSNFSRVIRFVNLPERCTIRIFNLAGDLVRTLEKTDPTSSTLDWDVLNEAQLPVASGIYVYHVDAPGVGSTIGKLAVLMEKERLNNF